MNQNSLENISKLRIFATICVVWLHTCSTLCEHYELFGLSENQYLFFNISYQVMYWAVPVFFMITGMLLLNPDKKITIKQCINKYIIRILVILFLFGIPFSVLKLMIEKPHLVFYEMIILAVKSIFSGESFAHLWYLYVLIGIYLILPLLRTVVNYASQTEFEFLLISLFFMDFVMPFIGDLVNINSAFDIPLKYSIFYVLMGCYINKKKPEILSNVKRNIIIIVLFTIGIVVLNYLNFSKVRISYTNPLIAIMSIMVFSVFILNKKKYLGNKESQNNNRLWRMDRLCFGVYLIHPLFIQFVYRFLKLTPVSFERYYIFVFIFFLCFTVVSLIASQIMSMIPLLKKYIF